MKTIPYNAPFILNDIVQKSKNKTLKKEWAECNLVERYFISVIAYELGKEEFKKRQRKKRNPKEVG